MQRGDLREPALLAPLEREHACVRRVSRGLQQTANRNPKLEKLEKKLERIEKNSNGPVSRVWSGLWRFTAKKLERSGLWRFTSKNSNGPVFRVWSGWWRFPADREPKLDNSKNSKKTRTDRKKLERTGFPSLERLVAVSSRPRANVCRRACGRA